MRVNKRTRRHHETKYIYINTRLCQACWECVEACPNGVIGKVNLPFHKHARIHRDDARRCKGCQTCVKTCPQQAIIAYHTKNRDNQEFLCENISV